MDRLEFRSELLAHVRLPVETFTLEKNKRHPDCFRLFIIYWSLNFDRRQEGSFLAHTAAGDVFSNAQSGSKSMIKVEVGSFRAELAASASGQNVPKYYTVMNNPQRSGGCHPISS